MPPFHSTPTLTPPPTTTTRRSQGYNKDIKWHDGELPPGVTDIGARVVSFRDKDTNADGYWYRYAMIGPCWCVSGVVVCVGWWWWWWWWCGGVGVFTWAEIGKRERDGRREWDRGAHAKSWVHTTL